MLKRATDAVRVLIQLALQSLQGERAAYLEVVWKIFDLPRWALDEVQRTCDRAVPAGREEVSRTT